MTHRLFNVILILLFAPFRCVNCQYRYVDSEATFYRPTLLTIYSDFSSMQLFHFKVPEMSAYTTWTIRSIQNQWNCPHRKVKLHIQHGGFPVINPLNESFPDHFCADRTLAVSLEAISGQYSVSLNLTNPRPGNWYAAAYVEGHYHEKIGPKELRADCEYALSITHRSTVLNPDYISVIDLPLLKPINVILKNKNHIYRFYVSNTARRVELVIKNCRVQNTSLSTCPVSMVTQGRSLPADGGNGESVNCTLQKGEQIQCFLQVYQPQVDAFHYVAVLPLVNETISFDLELNIIDCQELVDAISLFTNMVPVSLHSERNKEISVNHSDMFSANEHIFPASANVSGSLLLSQPQRLSSHYPGMDETQCRIMPDMFKIVSDLVDFQTYFSPNIGGFPLSTWIRVSSTWSLILPFVIDATTDMGGTLRLKMWMNSDYISNSSHRVSVIGCLQKDALPIIFNGTMQCSPANQLHMSTYRAQDSARVYIPYPESGRWFIGLYSYCEVKTNKTHWHRVACASEEPRVKLELVTMQCLDGGCAGHGTCQEFFSHVMMYSSCTCEAGWRGYGCTDGTFAFSESKQMAMALLLTLSNLSFIPAIVLATMRGYYLEALVYFFNMFFSAFYHACDNASLHKFCLLQLNVLSYCDFYGSTLSFWVTLIAMAKLPQQASSLLDMLGALSLAMTNEWKQHNTWAQIVPVAVGVVIIMLSWGIRCCRRRRCYPSKRRYLLFFLPGLALSGTAVAIFMLLETDENYYLTHSAWHMLIMLSVAFYLPPRKRTKQLRVKADYSPVTSEENMCWESFNLLHADTQLEGYANVQEPSIDL